MRKWPTASISWIANSARATATPSKRKWDVLSGLGFPHEEWNKRTEEFSGGWQMRIALAKLLLEKPNLLLLDEPTNHLDLEARNWLEQYLANYPFAFVLISHDRYFLDVTVNKIVEIWNRGVHFIRATTKSTAAEAGAHRAAGSRLSQPARAHRAAGSLSSTASAIRPPRRNRCRAASRSSKRSSASSCPTKRRPSTFLFRSPSRAGASWPSFTTCRRATARSSFSAAWISSSSAATASRWWASTGRGSRR
jgi:ATPase subunit of ABC transporter with duplicated ATPase domains